MAQSGLLQFLGAMSAIGPEADVTQQPRRTAAMGRKRQPLRTDPTAACCTASGSSEPKPTNAASSSNVGDAQGAGFATSLVSNIYDGHDRLIAVTQIQ